jgi:hypothetical protein
LVQFRSHDRYRVRKASVYVRRNANPIVGNSVRFRVAAIEDLLVKRLISAKFWKTPGDIEHAKLLAIAHGDGIDWEYVKGLAVRFEVADVLSNLLDAVSSSRRK